MCRIPVGKGTCTDGIYSDGDVLPQEDTEDTIEENTPGFGILPSMIALIGAVIVLCRQRK